MRAFQAALGPKLIGAEVLAHIARQRLSGTLSFGPPAKRYQLAFQDGRPEGGLAPGGVQLDQRPQLVAVVRACAVTTFGSCLFDGEPPARAGGQGIDTLGEALVAILENLAPVQLDGFWAARGRLRVQRPSPQFARLTSVIARLVGVKLAPPSPGTPVADLASEDEPTARRAWAALLVMGGVLTDAPEITLAPPQYPEVVEAEAAAPAAPVARPSGAESGDVEATALARQISDAHAKIDTLDHYQLLGVARDASADAVRKAYFAIARRWHSDQLRGLGLSGEVLQQAEALFRRADEANRTLSDPEKRSSYDWLCDRQAKGLPTDPAVIFEADNLYRRGQGLLQRGQAVAAEPLLRQATEMNPGEAEFWAHFGYAIYGVRGRDGYAEAQDAVRKALQLNDELDVAYEFLGRMARAEGLTEEALRHLHQALSLNPKNKNAERELRLLSMREQDKQGDKKAKVGASGAPGGGILRRLRRS